MQFIYIVEEKYNGFTIHDILKEHFGFSKLMLKRIRLNGIVVLNKKIKRMIDTAKTGDKIIIRTDQEFNDIHWLNDEEAAMAHDLFLLTNKPVMYVCNVDDASAAQGNAYVDAVREAVKDEKLTDAERVAHLFDLYAAAVKGA